MRRANRYRRDLPKLAFCRSAEVGSQGGRPGQYVRANQSRHDLRKRPGVLQDYGEASKWYRLAGDQGVAVAQASLGGLYENGYGVPREDVKERSEEVKRQAQEDKRKCELVQSLPKVEKRLQELQAAAEKKGMRCAASCMPPSSDRRPRFRIMR